MLTFNTVYKPAEVVLRSVLFVLIIVTRHTDALTSTTVIHLINLIIEGISFAFLKLFNAQS